jgi:hypothetical protein
MKNIKPLILGGLTIASLWFVAWLTGYNFDERNGVVAWWGLISLLAGFIVYFVNSKDYR